MKTSSLRGLILVVTLCALAIGVASANSFEPLGKFTVSSLTPANLVTASVPFPTAGDSYLSQTNGSGTIPSGGETDYMWTAGDWVASSVFVLPTSSVTGLSANWNFEDFLGGGNTETWYVLVNGIAVAQAILPDDSYNGDILNVSGSVSFAGIAPASGGYQVTLVLQNSVPFGGGSVAWLDGGVTGLTYEANHVVPEPGSLVLLGSGVVGLAGLLRRKIGI